MPATENLKKSFGGQISEDLYWEFKKAQAARHESTAQALEIAIRLYLEIVPNNDTKGDKHEQR